MSELGKSYDRGRYQVMAYFIRTVEEMRKRPEMFKDLDMNEELVKLFFDLFKGDLEKLAWVEEEKQEIDKILKNE